MSTERYLRLVEFSLWVLAAAAAAVLASLALGLLIGRDLVTVKYVAFAVGFLMFGAATIMMQPSGPDTSATQPSLEAESNGETPDVRGMLGGHLGSMGDSSGGIEGESTDDPEHRYEARLQEVGPLAEHDLPYERRVSRGVKLFVASLLVLGVSLLLELAGVQV